MLGKLFSFEGRTNRLGYLATGFVQGLIIAAALIILGAVFATRPPSLAAMIPTLIIAVVLIGATIWMGLAVITRRLRDMGFPALPGLVVILLFSGASQAMQFGHWTHPTVTPGSLLMGAASAVTGFALLFWPSAPTPGLDDAKLDDIFGDMDGPDLKPLTPDQPALVKAPSRLFPALPPKPAKPAPQPVFRAPPQPAVRDASGRVVARSQFGLRQSNY